MEHAAILSIRLLPDALTLNMDNSLKAIEVFIKSDLSSHDKMIAISTTATKAIRANEAIINGFAERTISGLLPKES